MKNVYDWRTKSAAATAGREWNAAVLAQGGGVAPDLSGDEAMKRKQAKENLVISSFDKQRLMRLLRTGAASGEAREELEDLVTEIERGAEVQPQEIPPDVVTMNSTVRVTDVDSGSTHVYTIVFPADADYEKGKISILAPLGTALLGYRVGDTVNWQVPRGVRRLKIEEILYQPEAAGDFHL